MAVRFDFYEDYCDFLAGGFIDRFDEVSSEETFKAYDNGYKRFVQERFFRPLNICGVFWPNFQSHEEF